MRWVNLNTWKRKRHFEMFKSMDFPHFNICADVDVTQTIHFCKHRNVSSSMYMIYLISRSANEIENFRYRIRDEKVCLHDRVDPAFTVLNDDELYYHCTVKYESDFERFEPLAIRQINISKNEKRLQDSKGRDDVLHMSCIPWLKFSGISHAIHFTPIDSIPRFYWGKYENQMGKIIMPVSVQVHHGLADGLHVAKLFELLQQYLNSPGEIIV